jgi:hypothetical protein
MASSSNDILTFDPSGTSESGWFRFHSIHNWEIGTITGENSVEHGKNIDKLIKNTKPLIIGWETANFLKTKYANADWLELIYINGIIPYLIHVNNVSLAHAYKVYNLETDRAIKSSRITGLEMKQVKGERGRPKNIWYFQGQELTVHQRDAIAVFYVVWTKFLKRPWPWQEK